MKPQIEYSFENLHRQSINAMIRAAYGFIVPDQSERQQWLRFPRTNRHASLRDLEFKKPCAGKRTPSVLSTPKDARHRRSPMRVG